MSTNIKENIERFNTNFNQGLSCDQAELRKKQKLFNRKKNVFAKSNVKIIISNLFGFFNICFFIIIGVAIFLLIKYNEFEIGWNIFFAVILLCNMVLGFYLDFNARKALKILSANSKLKVIVIRDGKEMIINAKDIVLDDVILIEKDARIVVDGIVLQGEVGVDESSINGGSADAYKTVGQEVFSGTFVTSGKAYVKVEKVGGDCFADSLNNKISKIKHPSSEIFSFLKHLFLVVGIATIIAIVFIAITFAVQGKFASDELTLKSIKTIGNNLLTGIPIILYLLISVALLLVTIKLSKRKAQIQNHYSLEALARTDVLCVDKTNTITDGGLAVKKVIPLKANYLDGYIAQAVCNVLRATGDKNPTAQALLSHFDLELSAGVNVILPFNSSTKYAGASFKGGKTYIIGAPEYMPIINQVGIVKRCEEFIKDGYRVIVLGEGAELIKDNKYPGMLEPIALIILKDHIRNDVPETFTYFKNNGVDIKVISGDDAKIASIIATEAGVANAHKYISLEGMPLGRVKMIANDYTVFGRATPEQKEAIIAELKESNKTVSMIGDGINDLLALKSADCSITLSSASSEAKNISDIILLNSNFNCLQNAVKEGRRVTNNIQRIAPLFIAKTIFAFVFMFAFMLASFIEKDATIEYPFTSNHFFLWDIIISGFAALALLLNDNNEQIKGKFLSKVFKKAISGAILLITCVAIMFVLFSLQRNGLLNLGVYSREGAVAMSVIAFNVLGIAFLYETCFPLTKYRRIVLIGSAGLIVLSLTVTAIISFSLNITEPVLQIPYLEMNGVSFITILITIIVTASIYLLVHQIISIVKKEDAKNEN